MKKEIIIWKRKKARELKRKDKNLSTRDIADKIQASKNSVSKWLNMSKEKLEKDNRGKQSKRRKYSKEDEENVKRMREELVGGSSYFWGLDTVCENLKVKHKDKDYKKWFVYDVLKKNDMLHKLPKKIKNASKYMQYPVKKLSKLGRLVMAMDFVGPKYLNKDSKGVNFLSIKYLRPLKYGIVNRVNSQTTDVVLNELNKLWIENPIPDLVIMDNDSAFGGNLTHKNCIGRVTKYLLNLGVSPLYIAPSSPWNNGSVEGYNSIFGKKFWNEITFDNREEIDVELKKFNLEYKEYTKLINNNPTVKNKRYLNNEGKASTVKKAHKIYFLRVVRRTEEKEENGNILILGVKIQIEKEYINNYVFCELDVKEERIKIGIEINGKMNWIKNIKFKIKNFVPSLNQT